ncbi:unnamed protein product [Trichobilharzia regenti]|nr:unnamed protein product [Trichobilharzia regenti]
MENGRNTNLRSPVRPVSPLSRWQKAPLPLVDDNDDGVVDSDSERDDRRKLLSSSSGKHGNRIITRSSSRSPALFSSVHLASTGTTTVVDIPPNYNKGKMPENEIQLNTWIDASLAELAEEVRSVVRVARRRGTRMHFAVVYPDSRGTYGRHQLGVVITGYGINSGDNFDEEPNNDGMNNNSNNNTNSQKPFNLVDDSAVMLISKKFQIGDCVDCAIVECTPGSLGGWSSGRRPLGPPPPSQLTASDSRISALEEARMI